jgi:hypothetical protein
MILDVNYHFKAFNETKSKSYNLIFRWYIHQDKVSYIGNTIKLIRRACVMLHTRRCVGNTRCCARPWSNAFYVMTSVMYLKKALKELLLMCNSLVVYSVYNTIIIIVFIRKQYSAENIIKLQNDKASAKCTN